MFNYWSLMKKQELAEIRQWVDSYIANLELKANRGEAGEQEQEMLEFINKVRTGTITIGVCPEGAYYTTEGSDEKKFLYLTSK